MNVLVGCEFSGIVREAFRSRGHNAYSNDLLPAADGSEFHLQMDVFDAAVSKEWDLAIYHPPCTFLCSSGLHWNHRVEGRQELTNASIRFCKRLLDTKVPRIALENPVGALSTNVRKPDQIIQPWMFGHGETKATCLWLKNLPKLIPTNIVEGREQRMWKMPPSPDRWKLRSITYQGIADAMATQWGTLDSKE